MHRIGQVAEHVMHQWIIGLPRGDQVYVPEGLVGSTEGVGRVQVTGDELALEEGNYVGDTHPWRKLERRGIPISRGVSQTGFDLVLDSIRRDVVTDRPIHMVRAPHAAIAAVGGVRVSTTCPARRQGSGDI